MKNTTTQAPASDEGGNHGSGNAANDNHEGPAFFQKPPTLQDHLKAVTATPPSVYGQISYGSGATYAVGDPVLPTSDGAKVKMDLSTRKTNDRVIYIENHINQMLNNASFPTPLPSAVDFLAQFTAYRNSVLAADAAETVWKDSIAQRDEQWAGMLATMNMRGAYVQAASNGNRQVIISSGLGVKNPPSPIGTLHAPLGLRVDLNGTVGKMILNWSAVQGAKGYLLECAVVVNGVYGPWELIEAGGKPTLTLNGMIVGREYAFHVAAMGGDGGRSDWSATVIRTAA
ncbi:MAG: fibronectin type III domain-containing protein [Prosthecobacter sp.]